MGVKPIFYQLSTVYESVFIFFYYGTMEQNDGSVMGVKSIFIGFPWWITCSSSFAFLLEIERMEA
jgi:hypothetical protein